MDGYYAILIERGISMRMRIENLLETLDMKLHVANVDDEVISFIIKNFPTVSCIILNADKVSAMDFDLIQKIRDYNKNIPIIILSPMVDKSYYLKAIQKGASDFLLKPFSDDSFVEKINKNLEEKGNRHVEIISFDLWKYLSGEFKKAEKGKFSLTLMLATLYVTDSSYNIGDLEFKGYLNKYFESVKNLFWDTDLFVKFDARYYLGVFPFSTKQNSMLINEKMKLEYSRLVGSKVIPSQLSAAAVFVTFPEDATEVTALEEKMFQQMKKYTPEIGIFNLF